MSAGTDPRWAGWPGAKSAAGVAHRIIGQFPPHSTYCELFLGHGTILRAKRPAARTIGVDVDPGVIAKWRDAEMPGIELLCADALRILSSDPAMGSADTLVYLDPPYLRDVRSSRRLYTHEFWTGDQHADLLGRVMGLDCMVAISGYPSSLYTSMLEQWQEWRYIDYQVMTRGGARTERLWMNFAQPSTLHDPRFGGANFRERERVKRKRQRWAARFAQMQGWERQLVRDALDQVERPSSPPPSMPHGEPQPISYAEWVARCERRREIPQHQK